MDIEQKKKNEIEALRRISAMPTPLSMLKAYAASTPESDALVFLKDASDPQGHIYSYADAAETAYRLAGALQAMGLGPDDSVAIIAPSVPEMMLAMAAAATVSIAFPLNIMLSSEAIASQLKLARVRVVVFGLHPALPLDETIIQAIEQVDGIEQLIEIDTGAGRSALLENGSIPCTPWADVIATAVPYTDALSQDTSRAAALFHTGGTTGDPKLAELSLGSLMASVHAAAVSLGFQSTDRIFQLLPFFHVGGGVVVGLGLFSAGSALINASLSGARDPEVVTSTWLIAARMKATMVCLVPTTWSQVAALGAPEPWLELRALLTGASSIAPELVLRLHDLAGVPMAQCLGMTEMSGSVANQPIDAKQWAPAVGFPMPLVECELRPISEGGPEEVYLRSPLLFRGYRTREGLVEVLQDGWLSTGDLGEILQDGQLCLVGRAKDVIIRSGHNIDPLTIEAIAGEHPDVVIASAVGIPDAYAGELPVVYAVLKPGATVSEEALQAFIADKTEEPPAKARRVFFIDALPMTGVGKVTRYKLRQMAAATKVSELLQGINGIVNITCEDRAAKQVTIDWMGEDKALWQQADTQIASLGLTLKHTSRERDND